MFFSSLIISASYCAVLVLLFTIPFRRRAVVLRAGKVVWSFGKKKDLLVKGIFICILCALMIYVISIRRFSVFVQIAFCGTAILGVELAVRELSLYGLNGVFVNGIIYGTDFVDFDDIATFPVLQLPENEQEHYPKNVLVIATRSRGKVELIFESEEKCRQVTEAIFKQRPDLKIK